MLYDLFHETFWRDSMLFWTFLPCFVILLYFTISFTGIHRIYKHHIRDIHGIGITSMVSAAGLLSLSFFRFASRDTPRDGDADGISPGFEGFRLTCCCDRRFG